jgi:hypothetical protein
MNAAFLLAQDNGAGAAWGIFGGAAALVILLWVVGLAATVFWLWLLVDALLNEPTTDQKILWFLVMFFLPIVGSLVYLFVRQLGRPQTTTVRQT